MNLPVRGDIIHVRPKQHWRPRVHTGGAHPMSGTR
jgi:hypothetical protein